MDKDKRITTIVLDKEADRKSKIIAEFTGKTLSAIYREALDLYFEQFITNELLPAIRKFDLEMRQFDLYVLGVNKNIKEGKFADAAVIIAEEIKQLPRLPETQALIHEGIKLISILSK